MKHVYGKRNKTAIFLRGIEAKLYKILSGLSGKNNANAKNKVIFCYPAFNSEDELVTVINKFAWAFPETSGIQIKFAAKKPIDISQISFPEHLSQQAQYYKNNKNIEQVDVAKIKDCIKGASLIAIHDKKARYRFKILPYLAKVKIIDPEYYSLNEGNFWKFGYYDLLDAETKERYRKLSLRNYLEFKKKYRHKTRANIFVTGPSYSSYPEHNYHRDESLMIVCNTIVKDEEFLEFIGGPDIITFADPVFHFSSCEYAHVFRELIIKAVRKYGSYIAVPASTVPLMLGNYPELADKIIGLRRSEDLILPNEELLACKPSGSIITFIMLPLATSLADEIYILGADGRGNNESYFWKHNEKVQLEELKESVFITHPSFFRDRDYSDHYKHHCDYVEEVIIKGEQLGKKYYSYTNSFIPALQERQLDKKD